MVWEWTVDFIELNEKDERRKQGNAFYFIKIVKLVFSCWLYKFNGSASGFLDKVFITCTCNVREREFKDKTNKSL